MLLPTWLLGPWGYVLAAAVPTALVGAGVGWTVHKVDTAFYDEHLLADKKAELDAAEIARLKADKLAALARDAGFKEGQNQQAIADRTNKTIIEVPRYVKDSSTCITYGLVRVLDARALDTDPATLELPAGKSNDACAPVTNTALAASVVNNYGASLQNGEQLEALQQWERDRLALDTPQKPESKPGWFKRNFGL